MGACTQRARKTSVLLQYEATFRFPPALSMRGFLLRHETTLPSIAVQFLCRLVARLFSSLPLQGRVPLRHETSSLARGALRSNLQRLSKAFVRHSPGGRSSLSRVSFLFRKIMKNYTPAAAKGRSSLVQHCELSCISYVCICNVC